jgi:hypothetical protein
MVRVCYCPGEPGFSGIGKRGIKVCQSWRDSYDNFKRDMGLSKGRRLQRKNNAKGFDKGNCYWGMSSG